MSRTTSYQKGRHRFAVFLAASVVFLIAAGALVTSTESGLSVPDWPLSYGSLNPPNWWTISTVRAEHGHRLIAGTVAMMTVLLAVWTGLREGRRWVRRLSYLAVATVLTQALLGGLTVLFFLPTPISVSHAGLAELFLCMTVTMALVTSRWWHEAEQTPSPASGAGSLFRAARWTTLLIFCQILLGAVMRHTGAGLAIPDFPLVFGGLFPPQLDFGIGVHYAHRLGALVVTVAIAVTVLRARRVADGGRRLRLLWVAMSLLVLIQISLGGAVVLTAKATVPNTAHVATGATLLATSVLMTLTSWRLRGPQRLRDPEMVGSAPGSRGRAAQPNVAGGV